MRRLHRHLCTQFPYPFRITIADNASTDRTPEIARHLAAKLSGVRVRRLDEKGRGWPCGRRGRSRTRRCWPTWTSTCPPTWPPCRWSPRSSRGIRRGHRQPAGPRLAGGAGAEVGGALRGYNLLLQVTLAARFTDAQCGFKAIRKDVADSLLPLARDMGWFFDTELLVLAQRAGLRIHEVPVDWVDDPDSQADIMPTVVAATGASCDWDARWSAANAPADRRTPAPARLPGRWGGAGPPARPVRGHRRGQHGLLPGPVRVLRVGMDAQVANVLAPW